MSRDSLLKEINEQRRYLDSLASVSSFSQQREAAFSLLTDTSVQKAFDVHGASPATLDRYGRNSFRLVAADGTSAGGVWRESGPGESRQR